MLWHLKHVFDRNIFDVNVDAECGPRRKEYGKDAGLIDRSRVCRIYLFTFDGEQVTRHATFCNKRNKSSVIQSITTTYIYYILYDNINRLVNSSLYVPLSSTLVLCLTSEGFLKNSP